MHRDRCNAVAGDGKGMERGWECVLIPCHSGLPPSPTPLFRPAVGAEGARQAKAAANNLEKKLKAKGCKVYKKCPLK